MLYSGNDLKNILRQMIFNAVVDFIILAASIVTGFMLAMNINETLGIAVLSLGLCLFLFVLGYFVLPCVHYYRYLLDLFTGRYTKRSGFIRVISPKPMYKDNKNYYYEVELDFGNGYNGLFLYDANLGKPTFAVGDKKTLISYENFIVKVEE